MRVLEAPVSPADATARIAALEASLARANAALAARDLLIDTLRGQIARLRRMQFGASSEKLGREIEQLELALEELETERDVSEVETAAPGVAPRLAPVRSLPEHLPREEVVHEPASGICTCPDCGGALRRLGVDAHEMLDIVPVRWRVVRDVRPKYSCRSCEKIVQAPAPVSAVARGKATFATLAHVVVSKFDHHLPLYRQAEMMAAQGLEIDRSTLAGWAGQAAALLDPVVSRIRDEVLKTDKIHADDTPVSVLDPGRGKTATGRLWVYAADDQASGSTTPPATWYRFTPDLHVDIERARQLLLRNAPFERSHDHVVLLNRRKPVHTLVVGEGLVVIGDHAGGFRRAKKAQGVQTHMAVQKQIAAPFLTGDRQRLDQADFSHRGRNPAIFDGLAHARRQRLGRQQIGDRQGEDLPLKGDLDRIRHPKSYSVQFAPPAPGARC